MTSLTVTATATETKPTPSASVVDPVRPMPTAMASATTSMTASVTLDACGVCNGPGAIYDVRLR